MKRSSVLLLALCALPAQGDHVPVSQEIAADLGIRLRANVLMKCAAIEALGVARTGETSTPTSPSHSSLAPWAICTNTPAITPLRARFQVEQVEEVRLAISALRDLDQS